MRENASYSVVLSVGLLSGFVAVELQKEWDAGLEQKMGESSSRSCLVTVVVPLLESFGESLACLRSLCAQDFIAHAEIVLLNDKPMTRAQRAEVDNLRDIAAEVNICLDATLTEWAAMLPAVITTNYFVILEPFDTLVPQAITTLYELAEKGRADCVLVDPRANASVTEEIQNGPTNYSEMWLSNKLFRSSILLQVREVLVSIAAPLSLRGLGLPLLVTARAFIAKQDLSAKRGERSTRRRRVADLAQIERDLAWARACLSSDGPPSEAAREQVGQRVLAGLAPVFSTVRKRIAEKDQARLFDVCRTTVSEVITPTNVMAAVTNEKDWNCLAAIQMNSPDLFFGKYDGPIVFQDDGSSQYAFPLGLPSEWVGAFSVELISAQLEYADDQTDGIKMSCVVNIPWACLCRGSSLSAELVIGSEEPLPTTGGWHLREEGRRQPDFSVCAFRVPIERLSSGAWLLTLELLDESGARARIILGITSGACRSSRRIHRARRYWQVAPTFGSKMSANLIVTTSAKAWWWQAFISLLAALRDHTPYAKHRVVRLLGRIALLGRDVWLIGERRDTAQDNGWVLFQYLRHHPRPGRLVFYLLDETSTMWPVASRDGHVIAQNSRAHKLLWLVATHLISSQDIDSFLLPASWEAPKYRRFFAPFQQARRIFLQHGVIVNGVGPILRRGVTGLDLFVCSCEAERSFLEATARGYTSKQLQLCGLPRFDNLPRDTINKKRMILVAPTWRRNLTVASGAANPRGMISQDSFETSEYRRFYLEFLTSTTLAAALERFDYQVVFVPHYEVRAEWESCVQDMDRVRVLADGGTTLAELLHDCQLFITDYSSTQFDAALGGATVVYSTFDAAEFFSEHYQPGWFDQRTDGFGIEVKTSEDLVQTTVAFVEGNLDVPAGVNQHLEKLGVLRDGHNCERVTRAISDLR